MNTILKDADFKKNNGLIPTIIQDFQTQQVLMLGYMNKGALKKTFVTKKVWFYSRSKKRLWMKGETSKNTLELIDIRLDCDSDTLLVFVAPKGSTCHTGEISCFGTQPDSITFLQSLFHLIRQRKEEMPEGSYTTDLFKQGLDRIVQKVGEEAMELVIASKNTDKKRFLEESADIFFHILVLFAEKGITLLEVVNELKKRQGEK